MRRLSRLLDLLGSRPALGVVEILLEGGATQKELLDSLAKAEIPVTQGTMTALMQRFEDLGLVARENQKAPYVLHHQDEVSMLLLHLATLGVGLGRQEGLELKAMEDMSRRARMRLVDQDSPRDAREDGSRGEQQDG